MTWSVPLASASRAASRSFSPLRQIPHARRPALRLPSSVTPALTVRRASGLAPRSESKTSQIFGALIILGVASTAYGVYEFYSTFTMWPQEVRKDLRAGIKAKNQGDLVMSERFLTRALETARTLPLEAFGSEPHLKLSGIAISLAGVLEDNHKAKAAEDVYAAEFDRLQGASDRTGPEKLRTGAIAYKLGQMAEVRKSVADERRWYEAACKELLDASGVAVQRREGKEQVTLAELELPSWVTKVEIVAPLRSLAGCYSRIGDHQLALTTLLVAVPILLGPTPQDAPSEHICLGADLMNSIADTLLSGPPTPEARAQAERAVSQAVELVELRRKRADAVAANGEPDYCDMVMAAALFNWGALREMDGDLGRAKQLYQRSRKHSLELKEREGIMQAESALRRVSRTADKNSDVVQSLSPQDNK